MSEEADDTAPSRPVLRIVRGEPDAAELAALTAVLAAAGGGSDDEAPDPTPTSGWARARRPRPRPRPPRPRRLASLGPAPMRAGR